MPTYDFKTMQIQTNKIIASGSTGTGASIMIYDVAADGSPENQGNIDQTVFATDAIGTDVFLYVSGSSNDKVSCFGGDVVISGALKTLGAATGEKQYFDFSTDSGMTLLSGSAGSVEVTSNVARFQYDAGNTGVYNGSSPTAPRIRFPLTITNGRMGLCASVRIASTSSTDINTQVHLSIENRDRTYAFGTRCDLIDPISSDNTLHLQESVTDIAYVNKADRPSLSGDGWLRFRCQNGVANQYIATGSNTTPELAAWFYEGSVLMPIFSSGVPPASPGVEGTDMPYYLCVAVANTGSNASAITVDLDDLYIEYLPY